VAGHISYYIVFLGEIKVELGVTALTPGPSPKDLWIELGGTVLFERGEEKRPPLTPPKEVD
jgi:hypothetical protein